MKIKVAADTTTFDQTALGANVYGVTRWDEYHQIETLAFGDQCGSGQARRYDITTAFDHGLQTNRRCGCWLLRNRMNFHGVFIATETQANIAVGVVDRDDLIGGQSGGEVEAVYDKDGNAYALDDGVRRDSSLANLAKLKSICGTSCEEYKDLAAFIKTAEAKKGAVTTVKKKK